ncbi:hypothetical protein GQ55_8G062000 [Panicum hallii var. hallii]|uniref:Cystatin domain-containing protein n=1 Tax=Panicum hallii var. hallii TaxID=1504633 RepID=A0A2T7CL68_9POAL|nr:hypothetical protein GQ55_8G061400 [Panicum hallii var. hallii]PUZ44087.1 hypothetical protein GQ55_8G061600 [Panicum hallii var. hallii]PUZ44089.1 hypothetical protein GQ55_8G061800 [Panicum hallii var. hallii]PUZ44091.1 hypothetical protein GQ55_8G062000 [Panicum hallii var. hallii]
MASLTTNALCIPTMVAAAAAPRCRRSLIVARASPAKHDERQDPAVKVDAAGGRRRAMVLFSAAAITASTAAAVRSARASVSVKTGTGQWVDIENVADPYVQDLGKWAVMEHNSQTREDLQFGKVLGGKQQVVAGMNYKLEIETKGGPSRLYEAGLFVSLPPEKRTLNSFEPKAG